jgi:hypothetical protein
MKADTLVETALFGEDSLQMGCVVLVGLLVGRIWQAIATAAASVDAKSPFDSLT